MKPELTTDELLLYWSDELSADQRADVEARLAEDPSAQSYLQELAELGEDMAALPLASTDRDWSRVVVEEADVVEMPSRRPAKVIPFWQHRAPQLIAASVLGLLGLVWLMQRTSEVVESEGSSPIAPIAAAETEPPSPAIIAPPEVVETAVAEIPRTESRKLSTRLFQSTSRLSARDRLQSWRERRAGLLDRSSFIEESSS